MRDIALTVFIFGCLPFVLRRPWLGVLLWTWIGMMNPHRLAWGFAFAMPFAVIVGLVTLLGFMASKEPKKFPVTPVTVTLILLVIWMNISAVFALPANGSYVWQQWDKVMKIHFFLAITMMIMYTAERIRWLTWVATLSIAFYGVKGGVFTLTTGGGSMVLGPDGSFISGNTEISLAITMVMPLLRYLQLQTTSRWIRWGLWGCIALCAAAVLGSHSRGGMLALAAMGGFLWIKSRKKVVLGMGIALVAASMLSFMPDSWFARMDTINTYEQDASAMGRINAWHFAFNLAKDRPLTGGGFGVATDESFARWAPNPLDVHDMHSIWFQVLGEQGFVGLGLFLILWWLTWRLAAGIIKSCKARKELRWAGDLAAMIQVSYIGYWVGGSFLGLAYWDLPYVLMAILVLTRAVVDQRLAVQPQSTSTSATRPGVTVSSRGGRA